MQKLVSLIFLLFTISFIYAQEMVSKESIEKGIEFHDEEKYSEAIKFYEMVHENDSNYIWMLAEKALTYLSMEKYDSAIYVADIALGMPGNTRQNLLQTKATAYDYLNQPNKAIEIYFEALSKYPYSYLLHYNLGITYSGIGNYKYAVDCYQEALRCNPFHTSSHMELGKIMARQKQYTRALLSLETFIVLEPASTRSNKILVFIENISTNYLDTTMGQAIEPFMENKLFAEIDHYIKAKVTHSRRFESVIDFNAKLVKQTQMLMEVLPFESTSDDFWVQLYFPFFKAIIGGDHLVPYLYTLLRSTGRESEKKYNAKNEKERKAFYSTGSYLSEIKKQRQLILDGEEKVYDCDYFDNGSMYSIGNKNVNEEQDGNWKYLFSNGEVQAYGRFVDGQKEGEWTFFKNTGQVSSVENYELGKLNGEYKNFHSTDKVNIVANYLDGEIEGEVLWHDISGSLMTKVAFVNSTRSGEGENYYVTKSLADSYNYKDGSFEGEYLTYYPSGQLAEKRFYKEGELQDEHIQYYSNGKISYKGNYIDGKEEGEWHYYYSNGHLKRIANYSNGLTVGNYKEYYHTGLIQLDYNFNDKGDLHGFYRYYDRKGELYLEEEYIDGLIIQVACINRDGDIYAICGDSTGSFEFSSFDFAGRKLTSGAFLNGKRTGVWTTYYKNGNPYSILQYREGENEGDQKYFYPNGVLNFTYPYEEDILSGKYIGYFQNGKTQIEGYYNQDYQEGIWLNYLANGELESTNYFLTGDLNGWVTNYAIDGSIENKEKYLSGRSLWYQDYNSTGHIINNVNLLESKLYQIKSGDNIVAAEINTLGGLLQGDLIWFYPSGNIYLEKTFQNGTPEGRYTRYFESGKVKIEGEFQNGSRIGKWMSYYESGKVRYINNYFENDKDSICLTYYENGNLRMQESYFLGELEGDLIHYDINGELMVKLIYSGDELIGYQYNKENVLCDTILIADKDQTVIAYYNSGVKSFEQHFKDFVPNGKRIKYYSDGSIRQMREYKNGLLEGKNSAYYPSGVLDYEFYCTDGLYQEEYIEYWESGKVKKIITYKDDAEHGETKYYNKMGVLVKVEDYWSGNFIGYKE